MTLAAAISRYQQLVDLADGRHPDDLPLELDTALRDAWLALPLLYRVGVIVVGRTWQDIPAELRLRRKAHR